MTRRSTSEESEAQSMRQRNRAEVIGGKEDQKVETDALHNVSNARSIFADALPAQTDSIYSKAFAPVENL